MINAIIIKLDNTCSIMAGSKKAMKKDETEFEFYERSLKNMPHIKFILREPSDFPPGRMEEWLYNPVTDEIELNEILLIKWDEIEEEFKAIGQAIKTNLGVYYLQLAQAVRDQDEEYLKISFGNMFGDPEVQQNIKEAIQDKLISYGVEL